MLKDENSFAIDNRFNKGDESGGVCNHAVSGIKRVFRALPDANLCLDSVMRIIMLTPAMEKILGYREDELLGQRTVVLYSNKSEFSELSEKRAKLNQEELDKPGNSPSSVGV